MSDAITKLTCPHCQRVGSTTKPVPDGAKVKCPGCGQPFLHQSPPLAASSPQVVPEAKPATTWLATASAKAEAIIQAARPVPMPVPASAPAEDARLGSLRRFLNEEQDPEAVEKAITFVQQLCTTGEEILFVAVQKKPIPSLVKVSVVLTSKRVIVHHQGMLGAKFEDSLWLRVSNAHVKEGLLGATFSATIVDGRSLVIDYLPKAQAKRLYQFAQEMEERSLEERRLRDLESKRASAGGVFVGVAPQVGATPSVPSAQVEDPMAKLQKLKAMLDAGLITGPEYESKKSQILASM